MYYNVIEYLLSYQGHVLSVKLSKYASNVFAKKTLVSHETIEQLHYYKFVSMVLFVVNYTTQQIISAADALMTQKMSVSKINRKPPDKNVDYTAVGFLYVKVSLFGFWQE